MVKNHFGHVKPFLAHEFIRGLENILVPTADRHGNRSDTLMVYNKSKIKKRIPQLRIILNTVKRVGFKQNIFGIFAGVWRRKEK